MARGNPAETISEKPLTNVLIVVLILVVIAAVVFVVLRGRQGKPNARVDPLADYPEVYDPHKIGVGDIITYAGIDHVVRGTITLDEEGYIWREHLLDGSTGRRWLTVEDDEGELEMTLWMRREGTNLVPNGDVILDDKVHRKIESGTAKFTAEGTTGTAPSGSMEYADYATADKTGLIAFEKWTRGHSQRTHCHPLGPPGMSLYLLDVEPTDVDASALGLVLGAPAPPTLAELVIGTSDATLTLGVLGASHVVTAWASGKKLTEQVSCDALAVGGELLPAVESTQNYRFESSSLVMDRVEFDSEAASLKESAGHDGWICGSFPGDDTALTALYGVRDRQGWSWQSWHLYPGEGTGVIVKTRSRWQP